MRYVVYSRVLRVDESFHEYWESGVGSAATFRKVSRGFFVTIEGSYEAIYLGMERPTLAPGDTIKIILEKDNQCHPSQSTNQPTL